MPKKRSWTDDQLKVAIQESRSYRMVLQKLGLVPAGGNYQQITTRVTELNIKTDHFLGKGWNTGWSFDPRRKRQTLQELLVNGRLTQSHRLRLRLIKNGLKIAACELCGWNQVSIDGRIPLELDHINGNRYDNRIENLRILCPNCHSLQPTHRGRNKKVARVNLTK